MLMQIGSRKKSLWVNDGGGQVQKPSVRGKAGQAHYATLISYCCLIKRPLHTTIVMYNICRATHGGWVSIRLRFCGADAARRCSGCCCKFSKRGSSGGKTGTLCVIAAANAVTRAPSSLAARSSSTTMTPASIWTRKPICAGFLTTVSERVSTAGRSVC